MTILVTGATGALGGRIVAHLLDRVPAAEIAVSVRDAGRAADLAAAGVDVRQADFDDAASVRRAFDGVDRLVLVSTNGSDDQRLAQHATAVRAAADAGVGFLAYTSVTAADADSVAGLAEVHGGTERAIRDTGIPFSFLRNNMYHENYTGQLAAAYDRGALVTATGSGRLASAARDDYAEAAAVVASTPGHDRTVYELTGPRAWTFDELAAIATGITGRPLAHVGAADADLAQGLRDAGLPGFLADTLVAIDVAVRAGRLAEVRPDLPKLLGRAPVDIADAARAALA
ncbi:SDR family oxidoreductase [Actinocatenispora rupis]|uniref:NAD(P)-dependent oxidoreductase n=1 Tax=Actinocatenispora rupis TaxID=519421 RepID=A0A8J3JGC1_9ACTN|nr:SDR family oxidoreductase [Actinocatenispora rupis]GID16194.1 NAD(P)-dependent oxidoreductase [Actinocatenispora rupis]